MGIAGAGLATVLGYGAGIVMLVPYLRSKQRAFRVVKPCRGDHRLVFHMMSVGLPKALTQGLSFLRALVLNALIVSVLGGAGMAAMTVCVNALMFAAIFIGGTNDTLLPIAGTLYGEKDYPGIRFTVRRGFMFMIVTCALLTALFLTIPGEVARMFGINSAEGAAVAISALRLYALSLPVYGLNLMLQNFYQTTGRQKLASITVTLNGFVFVVIFAYVLAGINGNILWLAFLLSEVATILAVLGIGVYMRQKKGVAGLLLLPREDKSGVFIDLSISASTEAAAGLSEYVICFCREKNVDESSAMRMGIAVEEMAVNIARYGHINANGVIDVLVRITEQDLILRLRDNGMPFNPAEYKADEKEKFAVGGIEVVRRLAKNVSYARTLGFNITIITILRTALKEGDAL
jgi:anti-sigma regulatory factor (Ser/Thr protein kinase)